MGESEVCICAAIRLSNGYIVRGHRHNDCLRTIAGMQIDFKRPTLADQGFMTSSNRFVGRELALRLQIEAEVESVRPGGYIGNELYSEDLY